MLRPSSFLGVLFFVSSSAVVACGGSVVFVEDGGDGGSGGSGPTTSSSPTTTKTTTKATTTTMSSVAPSTTTGMPTPCEILCASPAAQCAGGDCSVVCAGVYQRGCEAEADALILCYAQYLGADCEIGSQCNQIQVAYDACVQQPTDCQDFECQAEGDYCDCYGQCFGTNLEQYCYATPNQIECTCYGDFGTIGTCSQPNLSCSLDTGCCKQFFFDG